MNLKDWFDTISHLTVDEFAVEYKISRGSLFQWMKGSYRPSIKNARLINQITNNLVTFEELRKLPKSKLYKFTLKNKKHEQK
jgi:hypothetical protein